MDHKFKLGIDWHGVMDALPQSLAWLSRAIVDAGGEVHILTGMTWTKDCDKQLEEWGVKYTHTFSIFDHHTNIGTEIIGWHDKFNIPRISNIDWDQTKGEYCRQNNITLHLDDTTEYNKYFSTPFARIWTHNDKPKRQDKPDRHKH